MSLRQVQHLYDKLRTRYFMDAVPPLHVPPPAAEMRWGWLPETSGALGETHFDEDGDAEMIRLSHRERGRTSVQATLLHEMTHMRLGPLASCGSVVGRHGLRTPPAGSAWRGEAVRLAVLGGLQL